jgi:hypothetical protein
LQKIKKNINLTLKIMEKEKINQFIMVNGKFFPEMMIEDVKQKLESLDESKESMLMVTEWKNPTVAFLFAFFLGGLGSGSQTP